jgi:hypothetical protein
MVASTYLVYTVHTSAWLGCTRKAPLASAALYSCLPPYPVLARVTERLWQRLLQMRAWFHTRSFWGDTQSFYLLWNEVVQACHLIEVQAQTRKQKTCFIDDVNKLAWCRIMMPSHRSGQLLRWYPHSSWSSLNTTLQILKPVKWMLICTCVCQQASS